MIVRFGPLAPRHRGRLAEILAATGVFSPAEVDVALELFDETFEGSGQGAGGSGRVGELSDAGAAPNNAPTLPPPAAEPRAPASCPLLAYEFLGLFADNTLVGYACYGPTPSADGTFDLYWIAVHPAAQGAGAGGRLLREVERRVRIRGGRLLIVETSSRPPYARTRRFYDACGYREAARVADFYAPADDRVILAKRLAGSDAAAAAGSPQSH
jgi:ribosomal protein S18 acetylase RimI-like enzyme